MAKNKDKATALTRLVLEVFRAHQAIVSHGDRLSGHWGLNSAKWKTMGAIALAKTAITGPDIARSMALTRQAVQKQLDSLIESGMVVRAPNAVDGRAPLYGMTRRGERIYKEVTEAWTKRSMELGSMFDEAQLQSAVTTLNKLRHSLFQGRSAKQPTGKVAAGPQASRNLN
jgi:DNA-binding MarR family transcriptional regulator